MLLELYIYRIEKHLSILGFAIKNITGRHYTVYNNYASDNAGVFYDSYGLGYKYNNGSDAFNGGAITFDASRVIIK